MLHPEYLPAYLLEKPERIVSIGTAVCTFATFFMILAAYAKVLIVANAVRFTMSNTIPPSRVAELYPDWPTWFVAESIFGYLLIAIAMLVGLYAVYYGRRVKRIMDSF